MILNSTIFQGLNAKHIIPLSAFLLLFTLQNDAISCFTCSSRNHNDLTCEDPFSPSNTSYIERCMVPKKGRDGVFPAHFCIKVTGVKFNGTTKETLTVRKCALENMDNQCGPFKLDKNEFFDHGCILTCSQDGCNYSSRIYYSSNTQIFVISAGYFLIKFLNNV